MANQKYFLFTTLLLLIFVSASIKYLPPDTNLKGVVDKISLENAVDYQNYKLISIKYFNY